MAEKINLTTSQQNAISQRDCSLIISAGAGSGKTAVLTERILTRITDENDDCNISDFLVVTFTNAAAKELSDRIRKKLSERANSEGAGKKITTNLALLPLAKISTINAFCYELVRENFQKLGLSSTVRIADDAEMKVLKQKTADECAEHFFETIGDNSSFLTLYEIFSSDKSDAGLTTALLELSTKLANLPDKERFVNEVLEQYDKTTVCEEFFDTFYGKSLKDETEKAFLEYKFVFEKLIEEASKDCVISEKYGKSLEYECEFAQGMIYALEQGYEKARQYIQTYAPIRFSPVKVCEFPEIKEFISESKKAKTKYIKDKIFPLYSCDTPLLKLAAADTKKLLECLFDMVGYFDEQLCQKKKELGIIEFSDAERYALLLLCESTKPFKPTELALSLRNRYKEVYIDEYQDVNPLQDLIFRAITRTRNNSQDEYSRFMVGDIKQSIYKFRGARTDIFAHYRDTFCDVEKAGQEEKKPSRIFMSENFRCAQNVIDFVNFVFTRLMSGNYLEGDKLVFARSENKKVDYKTRLITFEYDKAKSDGASVQELEAAVVCDKIKELVNNPRYTNADGKEYTYSDVAILTRSKNALKVFEAVLSEKGINVYSDVGESFYGKKEILLCLNILNSIDNPSRQIYLAGYMRSFAGGFSDDELAIIKKYDKKKNLYHCVLKCAKNEDGKYQKDISEKCSAFIENLRLYRTYAKGVSADVLIWKLFCEMNLLEYCSSPAFSSDGKSAKQNLLKLYEMARDFGKTAFRGLGAFIDYINGSMEKDDIKSERVVGKECVSLMTIHASKGLEFPICFVCDLEKKFNKDDEKKKMVFSETGGVALMLTDTEAVTSAFSDKASVNINTPYRMLVNINTNKESIQEEMRILYVALTRAKDMLIMTGAISSKPETVLDNALLNSKTENCCASGNYLGNILNCIAPYSALKPLYDLAMRSIPEDDGGLSDFFEYSHIDCESAAQLLLDGENQQSLVENTNDGFDEKLLKELSENTVNTDVTDKYASLPAKVTVSRLKKGLIDEDETDLDFSGQNDEDIIKSIAVPHFIAGETEADGAEKGTAMHMFMQFVSFEELEKNGCGAEADRLEKLGFITSRQRKLLNIQKLESFFESSLYKQIRTSSKVYREQRFNLEVSGFELDESLSEELQKLLLVQGVIDLFFMNTDGSYTVVDFKTDRLYGEDGKRELTERHEKQLELYCKAVEQMTQSAVSRAVLYSFSMGCEVEIELKA